MNHFDWSNGSDFCSWMIGFCAESTTRRVPLKKTIRVRTGRRVSQRSRTRSRRFSTRVHLRRRHRRQSPESTTSCTMTRRNRYRGSIRTRAVRNTWFLPSSRARCRASLSGRSGRRPLISRIITWTPLWVWTTMGSPPSYRVGIRCRRYRTYSCTCRSPFKRLFW